MSDEWGDHKHRDKIQDGVTFSLKYLGSTLVEELEEEGTSYGDKISAVAINTIVIMVSYRHLTLPTELLNYFLVSEFDWQFLIVYIVSMPPILNFVQAKASKKKLRKVSLRVSPGGIIVMDSEDQSVITDLDIYRSLQ